ncbi:MAG: PAS domain S-box protein [Candidatus Omnitrophota bacterium]
MISAEKKNILIIGGDKHGAELVDLFHGSSIANIAGVIDRAVSGPGIDRAMALGIPVFRELVDLPDNKKIDYIIDAAGDISAIKDFFKRVNDKTEIAGPGIAKLFIDVTREYCLSGESLLAEKTELRKYLTLAGNIFIVLNPEGIVTLINSKGCEILGYDEKEIIGKNWFDSFLPHNERDEIKHVFSEIMRGNLEFVEYYENPVIDSKGEERIISWRNTFFTDENGAVTGVLSSGNDITESKNAVKALKDSEATLKTIFLAAPIAIGMLKDRVLQWTNEEMAEITGYSSAELENKNTRMIYPDEEEYLRAGKIKYEKAKEQERGAVETKWKRKDGKVIDILLSFAAIMKEDLSRGLIFTARDITQENKMRRDLNLLNKCFLSLGPDTKENIRKIVYTAGEILGGACVLYNRMKKGMLCTLSIWNEPEGYRTEDVPEGHICYDVIRKKEPLALCDLANTEYSKTDPNVRKYNLKSYLGYPVELNTEAVGAFCWCDVEKKDFTESDYNIMSMLAKAISIEEEREKVERSVAESAKRYRALFEGAAEGILVADRATRKILYVNISMCEMLGYGREEMLSKCIDDIHPEKSLGYVIPEFDASSEDKKRLIINIPCLRKDGKIIYTDIHTAAMAVDGKECNAGFFTDITERKRAYDMLIEAEKLSSLGCLIAEISHEINNPLQIVTGRAQLALMSTSYTPEQEEEIRIIYEQAMRAKDVIERLLKFSKPSLKEVEEVDINDAIDEIIKLLEHQYRFEDIEVIRDFDPRIPRIMSNGKAIQEVIFNLMNNAHEAIPDGGGKIKISTLSEGNTVKIVVSDSGTGISEDIKPRICEPFFTTKAKGTGLGLSVCFGIIEAHKGKMEFTSNEGKGTSVIITLPVTKSVQNAS